MNLAEQHQAEVDNLIGAVVEEELLEVKRGVQRDIQQPQLLIRNVLRVLVDVMLAQLPAFSNLCLRQRSNRSQVVQVHHLDLLVVLVPQLRVASAGLAGFATPRALLPRAIISLVRRERATSNLLVAAFRPTAYTIHF